MEFSDIVSQGKRGELETVIIDNEFSRCEIALFGGHILSFIPKSDNRDRLWLSPHADLTGNKPIRGGIPICWPWFADNKPVDDTNLASHGYMRSQFWSVLNYKHLSEGTEIVLQPTTTRVPGFEHNTKLTLTVTVGEELTVTLNTTNQSDYSITFTGALHSYFYVDKVINATLVGIDGEYKDKLDGYALKPTPSPYTITGETDRTHLCKTTQTKIDNANTVMLIEHQGHDSIVVWNPWMAAASMPDMDAFGYKNMLCVETAITLGKTLQPGDSHNLIQRIY